MPKHQAPNPTANPPRRISFLHLSDRHFQVDSDRERYWPTVQQEFFKDINSMAGTHGGPPRFVIFSGDLAYSGAEDEYKLAEEFFRELSEHCQFAKGTLLPIFAVPGNHDLTWPRDDPTPYAALRPNDPHHASMRRKVLSLKDKDEKNADPFRSRVRGLFANYSQFAEQFLHPTLGQKVVHGLLPGEIRATLEIEGFTIGLLGLNSAWRQYIGGIPFHGHLSVDVLQANELDPKCDFRKSNHVTFLVQHHPPHWLDDEKEWVKQVERRADHLLVGHVHEASDLVQRTNTNTETARTVAKSLYGVEEWIQWKGDQLGPHQDRRFGYTWGVISEESTSDGEPATSVRTWQRTCFAAAGQSGRFGHPTGDVEYDEPDGFLAVRARPVPDHLRQSPPLTARPPAPVPQAAPAPAIERDWRTPYFDHFRALYGKIRILGYEDRYGIDLEREKLQVSLSIRIGMERHALRGTLAPDSGHCDIVGALEAAVASQSRGLILIGLPGSGKTTLLHDLYLRQARGELTKSLLLKNGHQLIPVLVQWRLLTSQQLDHPDGLAEFISATLCTHKLAEAAIAITTADKAERPPILLLGDGIDELSNPTLREKLLAWVAMQIETRWPKPSFCVLTCRTTEYFDQQHQAHNQRHPTESGASWLKTLAVAELQLLGKERSGGREVDQRDVFVINWFTAVAHARGLDSGGSISKAQDLLSSMKSLEGRPDLSGDAVRKLLGTPLLLSQLCQLHHSGKKLPEQRGVLYEKCLGLLLEVWAEPRRGDKLPETSALELLRHLAWDYLEGGSKDLSKAALEGSLDALLPTLPGAALATKDVIELFTRQTGVLIPTKPDHFEFLHLSFAEWLAAYHAECERSESLLVDRLGQETWREVIALALSRPAFAPHFLREVVRRGLVAAHKDQLNRGLRELLRLDPAAFRDFDWTTVQTSEREALSEIWPTAQFPALPAPSSWLPSATSPRSPRVPLDPKPSTPTPTSTKPALRKEGDRWSLSVLGHTLEFCWVPPGPFWMGSSKDKKHPCFDPEARDNELEARQVMISSGYWIARTPTTNALYRAFVSNCALAGVRPSNEDRSPSFGGDLQPVVSIFHADAVLFTRWLNELRAVPRECSFDLPTEAEWERAARGTDRRKFPWGNEPPDKDRAVFSTNSGGQTAELGGRLAGASPCGALDMAGNVWEWCLDPWVSSFDASKVPVLDPGAIFHLDGGSPGRAPRVVRGGSWFNDPGDLRCATRGGLLPEFRDSDLGFRVVVRGSPEHAP